MSNKPDNTFMAYSFSPGLLSALISYNIFPSGLIPKCMYFKDVNILADLSVNIHDKCIPLNTSLNSPGGACRIKSDAILT